MTDDFASLFAYNRWADDRFVAAVRQLTPEQYTRVPAPECRSVHSILVHMADAAFIWLRRIKGEAVTGRTTEKEAPALEDALQFLTTSHEAFMALASTLSPEAPAATVTYVDLKGQPGALPVWAILRHVLNHSSYHRGQIAARLIDAGIDPPIVDLVVWASR